MGQGNSWGGEKRKYLVNKSCHALQVRFCVENLISDHSFVPGTGPLPNVNFPYERIFRASSVTTASQNNLYTKVAHLGMA